MFPSDFSPFFDCLEARDELDALLDRYGDVFFDFFELRLLAADLTDLVSSISDSGLFGRVGLLLREEFGVDGDRGPFDGCLLSSGDWGPLAGDLGVCGWERLFSDDVDRLRERESCRLPDERL